MTQKEIDQLTIFLGNGGTAFIGKNLKNGKPSNVRRVLSEGEMMNFVSWFIDQYCKKYGANEFNLSVNDVPRYRLGIIGENTEEGAGS